MTPGLCSVLQLIKSQKVPNKLVIVLETEKEKTQRKEYVFSDSKVHTQRFLPASLEQVPGWRRYKGCFLAERETVEGQWLALQK